MAAANDLALSVNDAVDRVDVQLTAVDGIARTAAADELDQTRARAGADGLFPTRDERNAARKARRERARAASREAA